MSNLPGNPLGEKYGDSKGLSAEVVSALIVAHELRTANLIALAQITNPNKSPDYDMESIYNRLGLG